MISPQLDTPSSSEDTYAQIDATAWPENRRRLAILLWNGDVGGAEVVSMALADRMRRLGVDATIVFLEQPEPLAGRLSKLDVPYRSLGFRQGRDILRHPRRYAKEITAVGPDGALLVECGFMGGALRAGGYRAPIIAVEHGAVLQAQSYPWLRRLLWRIARASGAWADDVEVAVSNFILARMRAYPHARDLRRIYNGVEPSVNSAMDSFQAGGAGKCTVAFGGRLIFGKGADYLIEAVAHLQSTQPVRLRIAGDGPDRQRLETLARSLGVLDAVEFLGLIHDMHAFWMTSDLAVIPSAQFTEACPMTPLEAMAAGKPIITTRNGGLPELVVNGVTGLHVSPGDVVGLAEAISLYASDSPRRLSHGLNGRARLTEHFHMAVCAKAYLDLFAELADRA